jgi:hypothetical protein
VSLSVRRYQAGDEAAVYDVCVRTGDDGQDATGKFADAGGVHVAVSPTNTRAHGFS